MRDAAVSGMRGTGPYGAIRPGWADGKITTAGRAAPVSPVGAR